MREDKKDRIGIVRSITETVGQVVQSILDLLIVVGPCPRDEVLKGLCMRWWRWRLKKCTAATVTVRPMPRMTAAVADTSDQTEEELHCLDHYYIQQMDDGANKAELATMPV